MRVGVLALQGAFVEHEQALAGLGVEPVRVRLPRHLDGLDGLILPGGESTTIGRLIQRWGLLEPIRAFAQSGRPLWGTCAGLILLARDVGRDQSLIGVLDVTVERNAFGRQVDSFEADLTVPVLAEPGRPLRAVFIRAPLVTRVGAGVDVLAHLDNGQMVAVRQGHLLGTVFHPELTDDDRFHRYFLSFMGR
jgi:5'-phosphate synthase pdxT subunit